MRFLLIGLAALPLAFPAAGAAQQPEYYYGHCDTRGEINVDYVVAANPVGSSSGRREVLAQWEDAVRLDLGRRFATIMQDGFSGCRVEGPFFNNDDAVQALTSFVAQLVGSGARVRNVPFRILGDEPDMIVGAGEYLCSCGLDQAQRLTLNADGTFEWYRLSLGSWVVESPTTARVAGGEYETMLGTWRLAGARITLRDLDGFEAYLTVVTPRVLQDTKDPQGRYVMH